MKNECFKNPPISEAIFDIRVELPAGIDISLLESFYEKIKDDYPIKQINTQGKIVVEKKEGEAPIVNSSESSNGFIYKSVDGTKIIQTRLDGFTFNKLKPYANWKDFSEEAFALWNEYVQISHPAKITRMALRYINLIELPFGIESFKEYFSTVPEISPDLPQVLQEFFFRLVIPYNEIKGTAIITQTIDSSKLNDKFIPYIFDIDVFKNVDLLTDDKNITTYFEELRKIKNDIFIKSLTEKAKSLFE